MPSIQQTLCTLAAAFNGRGILGIIYNQAREEGIKEPDCKFLLHLLRTVKMKNPVIVLHGTGGDFAPAIMMAHLLKKYFSTYTILIPGYCCSALVFLLFKAEKLVIHERSVLTQIDPTFPYQGEALRAIKHLKSTDQGIKDTARSAYDEAQNQIQKLIVPPSIFKYKVMEPQEHSHRETLIQRFLNKEEHGSIISLSDLAEAEVKFEISSRDTPLMTAANQLIVDSHEVMKESGSRVIFLSSEDMNIEGHSGTYICPLQ